MRAETTDLQHEIAYAVTRCRVAELQAHTDTIKLASELRQRLTEPLTSMSDIEHLISRLRLAQQRHTSFKTTRHQLAARLNPKLHIEP